LSPRLDSTKIASSDWTTFHVVDQLVARGAGLHAQIEVGHTDQLFYVGPAEERPAHQSDLLVHVWLDHEARKHWPEQRLGIDIHARARFVSFRSAIHHGHADDRREPRCREPDPPAVPHSAQISQGLL